ncbi:PorT family protein [Polaribacter sp. MSW13]|uniref:PorT family protein n=1 Tax=Polaribacter marinus TaxID=2916838 RepID=A0A9X1VLQ0_9FLAO|nr:porin family protein [Polaribacter marinus]MCI2228456.1 PorT family protein [Polaribacter marinus]
MKKAILIICLAFAFSQTTTAQIQFGIKGGINYNSNSIKEVSTDVFDGAKSKTGYHAGIWLRAKIPVIGLYIRPELVYTNLENEVRYKTSSITSKTTTYSFQKIDIPVLLGKKIFGIGNVYIGPSFQYILDSDFSISDIPDVKGDGFTVGLQFGGGIEFGKLGIDVRWERGFNNTESSFFDGTTNVEFDTRVNQIIIGLSYRL